MKKIILIAIILITINQKSQAQKRELNNVTIEELNEKRHPKDTSAVAAILFKKGDVSFSYSSSDEVFVMNTVVKVKIKIYKKEGYDLANQSVNYFVGGTSKESAFFENAVTYNLVDGKIEKTKLKKEGEFDESVNKRWNRKKITMPNVKEGSIIEFQYTIRSKRIGEMRDWYFQSYIPVNYSEFKTSVPEYFVYSPNQRGFIFPKVEVEKNSKSFSIATKDQNVTYSGIQKASSFENVKINYIETRSLYTAEDLPAMKEEAFVNNVSNYTSSVSHELSTVQYPNRPLKLYSTDWKSVTKTIYDDEDFGLELNKTGYFDNDLKAVLAGLETPEQKISAILNFVKSKVKWNNIYGFSCNDGVKKAYTTQTGNVAEINLMLTAMLRYAGLTANPVLLSTRSNGIALFPTIAAFDYVIAAVELNDTVILLDATEPFSLPNVLPTRDINWTGRMIRNDDTSMEIDLMPKKTSRELVSMNLSVDKAGVVDGQMKKQLTDNLALDFRQKYKAINKESYLEKLEKDDNGIEISDYVRENETDISKALVESFSFKDNKSTEIIGDKMYINPLLFLGEHENPFKQETREYPIDFGFISDSKYNVTIKLPDGYAVETLPTGTNIASAENVCGFKYVIVNNGSTVQIAVSSSINSPIVSADYYQNLKEFYKVTVEKQNQKIVLKKI